MAKTSKTLLMVLVPALVSVSIAFFRYVLPSILNKASPAANAVTVQTFAGRVSDEQTGRLLSAAKVSLEAKGLSPVTYTDSEGRFSFPLASDISEIRIRVDVQGYLPYEREIRVSTKTEDIRLSPVPPSPTRTPPPRISAVNKRITLAEQKRRALKELNRTAPVSP